MALETCDPVQLCFHKLCGQIVAVLITRDCFNNDFRYWCRWEVAVRAHVVRMLLHRGQVAKLCYIDYVITEAHQSVMNLRQTRAAQDANL